jgi:hypothetical protein
MSKVKVVADEFGNVVRVSTNNPEYGSIRVEQSTYSFDKGWMRKKARTAFIPGMTNELTEMVKQLNITDGFELSGNIIIKESLEPFNQENPDRDIKYAGTTGVMCTFEDQIIYRKTYYTESMYEEDEMIPHTNTDEIRAALQSSVKTEVKAVKAVKAEVKTEVEVEVKEDEDAFSLENVTDESSNNVAFDF